MPARMPVIREWREAVRRASVLWSVSAIVISINLNISRKILDLRHALDVGGVSKDAWVKLT